MAFCEDKGIPHSVFLGRVVGPGEPYWLPEDRAKVIAWRLERAAKCSKCGTADWEWDENPDAYEPVALRCMGCHKKNVASEDIEDRSVQVVLMPPKVAARLRSRKRVRPKRRRVRHERDSDGVHA